MLTAVIGLLLVIGCSVIMVEFREMVRLTLFGSRNTASRHRKFEPVRDIPSLAGKVVLITGAAGDLGRQMAVELARHGRPARIYVADLARDGGAKEQLVDQITREAYGQSKTEADTEGELDEGKPPTEVRFLELDLTSFESIRRCAAELVAREDRLDILVLNAGILRVAPGTTKAGYEVHFGLNYLGHALLSRLLTPTMLRTAEQQPGADVRLVIVSSEGHAVVPKGGIQFDKLKTDCAEMMYMHRYGQSKLALVHLTRQLARAYPQLKIVAVHPGRVLTGLATSLAEQSTLVRMTKPFAPFLCVAVSVGVRNHLWAVSSPAVVSGKYYVPVGVPDKDTMLARDEDISKKLWEWTETELKGVDPLQ